MSLESKQVDPFEPDRRRYDSPIRRQKVAERRDAIVAAGCELAREIPTWDWRELTFRAVAERAGVSMRTVYRYFPTERGLHDAVMRQLEQEAGVEYQGITIDGISEVARKVFSARSAFAVAQSVQEDPAFVAEDERRQDALLRAVAEATSGWSDKQEKLAAAILDMLWSVQLYERLVTAWQLDDHDAEQAVDWAIAVVVAAIREDVRPNQRKGRRR
jgi:AcrR family transcriptional regulator